MRRKQDKSVRVAVSGSFHRHMGAIADVVEDLSHQDHIVLSPADPRVVDSFGEFLFVASDIQRSIRLVQSRHFQAIVMADFLWLECPDGYVGTSASLEIGFAVALGKDIYSTTPPSDLTLRQYVTCVSSLDEALRRSAQPKPAVASLTVLIDPLEAVDQAHKELDLLATELVRPSPNSEPAIESSHRKLESLLILP